MVTISCSSYSAREMCVIVFCINVMMSNNDTTSIGVSASEMCYPMCGLCDESNS